MKRTKIILLAIILIAAILRFWNLGINPPSLYWDEASLGYNAYSILKTGKDEHGQFMPIARFIAFGDYKPPGYIYASVPFIALFGLNEFSIRFASAFAGLLSVLLVFFLVKELFESKNSKLKDKLPLVSAAVLAISPWHLQFSRGAFEANLATFFSATGVYFFLRGVKKGKYFLFSALFFVLSIYTFNTHRVFVPALVLILTAVYAKRVFLQKKWAAVSVVLGILLILPVLPFLLSREGSLRFQEVTIFRDHAPILKANERAARENNSLTARIVHNRRVQYTYEFAKHYTDHFKSSFLFLSGDVNPRLGTKDQGNLYLLDSIFILAGLYVLIRKYKKQSLILLLWVLIGIIPAATARETPHALRTLNILPAPQIIVAIGIFSIYQVVKKKSLYLVILITCYLLLVTNYLHTYHAHYPKQWAGSWQYGYKQMVDYVSSIEEEYDKIFITRKYGRPYIFVLLYKQFPPEKYWQSRRAQRDWFGFWTVEGFDKFGFGDFPQLDTRKEEKWLLVAGSDGLPAEADLLKEIHFPNGEKVFEIGEIR